MWWFLVYLSLCVQKCVPQIEISVTSTVVYQIAGIFESAALTQRMAFRESMRHANIDQRQLDPIIIQPIKTDSYSVWNELCKNKAMRPIAIFGPQNAISDGAIRDQCAIAEIPHIQAAWQPFDPDLELNEEEEPAEDTQAEEIHADETEVEEEAEDSESTEEDELTFKKITINFHPDADEITMAYAKLLKYYQWESFSVLYEDDFGLSRVQKILAEHTDKFIVTVRKLDPETGHKVFKELKKYQESRILLDCHVDRITHYMKVANNSKMVNHYQHYILMSMDASTVVEKLTPYESNITWFSMTEYDELESAQHILSPRVGDWHPSGGSPVVSKFQLETLIMDDIANHVVKSVREVEKAEKKMKISRPPSYVCSGDGSPWPYGAKLQNQILKTQSTGVTGNVQFDDKGRRVNYTLYVNEIRVSERHTIGRWLSSEGEDIIDTRRSNANLGGLDRKHFIIISRMAKPYFYYKEKCESEDCEGNDETYEGFSVDLVKEIFTQLKIENPNSSYTYSFVYDKEKDAYGVYNPETKKWNGLIGDLLDNKADLAVCDLTITEERKKIVDFSVPFMSLGISILYTKEYKVNQGMYSFLNPYSLDVWIYIATAYCVVTIVLFICARISPADWENPQPCDKDPEELENIWNFKNCAWLTMGSIMTQGCDILPKGFGTRWVCGMWWFFAMIVCQTYIAQLAASMTSALENVPINEVEDLAKQSKILYGAINGGSTLEFFKSSKDKMYKGMYDQMIANPAVLVKSNDEGEKRVVNGKTKYAFFMESSSIEYKLKRDCALKKVGGELDSKDYGIAMPANSPFRSRINRAILKLKELTTLDQIKKKWWEEKYGGNIKCEDGPDENDVEGDLEMENLIGAFLVLIMGLAFGLLITAAEFMNEVRNIVVREQVTHKEAFIQELKASLNFCQLQKPVLRNPSRAPSMAPSLAPSEKTREEKLKNRALAVENFMDFEKQTQ